jgi:alpha-L-rhamnosidase
MIRRGATTTWEDWLGDKVLIHPGLTSPCLWLYEGLAGIQTDPAAPGFKRIVIKPAVVDKPEVVEAWHNSLYGRIAVRREIKEGEYSLVVDVPPNATAEVHMPAVDAAKVTESGKPVREAAGIRLLRYQDNRAVFEIGSGRYWFTAILARPDKSRLERVWYKNSAEP